MKIYILFLAGLFASMPVFAAGNITYLNVVDDIVYFTTDEVKAGMPSCVVAENAELWAVSLNHKTGRALYSLLVTAMAGKQAINVESGADCGDIAGIERAKGISLQPTAVSGSAGSTSIVYLYKGDGETKLGRVIGAEQGTTVSFLSPDNNKFLQTYSYAVSTHTVDFDELDCSGNVYMPIGNYKGYHPFVKGGMYVRTTSKRATTYRKSNVNGQGVCTNYSAPQSATLYPIDTTYADPLCGDKICIFKEE